MRGNAVAGGTGGSAADIADGPDPGDDLERALRGAHLPTLLMVLVHLTGDRRWLSERYRPARPRGGRDPDDGGLPEDVQQEIRDGALAAVHRWRSGLTELFVPSRSDLAEMMGFTIGEEMSTEYVDMVAEEIGLADRDATWDRLVVPQGRSGFRVLVIGAGFSGLCLAMKLERARIPYSIIEKNEDLGGTWLENRYPGCGVDSPSHLYQFSFEPNAHWPRYYSTRDDIHGYLLDCADRYGVRDHIRFGTEVRGASWDAGTHTWQVEVSGPGGTGEQLTADVVISAVGQLNRPSRPSFEGADSFAGPALHTAEWTPSLDVRGKRVAVIGTGASAMQLVPTIAGVAEQVTVFQRSPQWAVPNPDYIRAVSEQTRLLLDRLPFYSGWYRYRQFWLWNDHIHPTLQIDPDWPHPERSINAANEAHRVFLTRYITELVGHRPELLAKCLPTYPPYGKRMLMDNGWFTTVCRDDVELVTSPVESIRPGGVVTADGTEHSADVLVYATGFDAHRMLWPMRITGRDSDLHEVWGEDDARAYLGMAVPGFPNFFTLYGPNTNLGHGGSVVYHTELQFRYVMGMLRAMLDRDLAAVEVRRDVHDDYNRRVDEAHARMIWSHRGMDTWYRNRAGRVVNNSPWRLADYWRMTRSPDLRDYDLEHR